jgi:hypothetical protein
MALDMRKKFFDFCLNLLSQDHLFGGVAFEENVPIDE